MEGQTLVVAAVREEVRFLNGNGNGTDLLLTGMGPDKAFRAVRDRLRLKHYRWVISIGFAGGTQPCLRVGDLVIASEAVDVSSGKRLRPQSADGRGPFHVGPVATVRRPLRDPRAKAEMGERYRVIAVDMETAAVASAAAEQGIPWAALRVILDPMETRLAAGSWQQALGLLARPSGWRDLGRLLGAVREAGRSLGDGWRSFMEGHRYGRGQVLGLSP